MRPSSVDTMLETVEVHLKAFAMCEIERAFGLACGPLDAVVFHFVLDGEGCIEWKGGQLPLSPGTMAVIPRNLSKTINGPGPVVSVLPARDTCPLADGLVRFCAGGGSPGLLLGCASVDATAGAGTDIFDRLRQPFAERAESGVLPMLFKAILAELRTARPGTKAIVEAMMKQITIFLLRNHFAREGMLSPLFVPAADLRLRAVVAAVLQRPGAPH